MISVDFSKTQLTETQFESCDLQSAIFEDSNLEKVDFRTAFNYTFDPEKNKINKARFSKEEVMGLLTKYDIRIE